MASSRRLRALITNDDGIDSPGLWALARGAQQAGFEVTVAAPHHDASGVGASIQARRTGDGFVRIHSRELAALPGVPAFAVEGPPAFIVLQAMRGWLDPAPDVVLSGINLGANTGRVVLHSGTVGAALTAGLNGLRALAVSLDTPWWSPVPNPCWEAAVSVLPEVLDRLLSSPEGTVLSLNAPDRPVAELGALREATLAEGGQVEVSVTERADPEGTVLETRFLGFGDTIEPGSDRVLLAEGHPTVTELRSISTVQRELSEAAD